MRVIFYALPTTLEMCNQVKKVADKESEEARWVTIEELKELGKGDPGLRGRELLEWAVYLEMGGQVWPIQMFGLEGQVQSPTAKAF